MYSFSTKLFSFLIVAVLLLSPISGFVLAQEQSETVDLQSIVDQAEEKGLNVIVIGPQADDPEAQNIPTDYSVYALQLRSEARDVVRSAPKLFSNMYAAYERVSPDGSLNWLWLAMITAIAGIIVGTWPSYLVRNWNRDKFSKFYNPEPANRAEKISYLMLRALLTLASLVVAAIVAVTIALIFDTEHNPSRATIGAIIGAYLVYQVFQNVIFSNLIAPDVPSHRVVHLDDAGAERMQRNWKGLSLLVICICTFFVWTALLGLQPVSLKLLVILSLLCCAILVSVFAMTHRQDIAGIIRGEEAGYATSAFRQYLANNWHWIFISYISIAWLVSTVRILLNLPGSLAIVGAPVVALVGAIAGYAFILIFIDQYYSAKRRKFERRAAQAQQAHITMPPDDDRDDPDDSPALEIASISDGSEAGLEEMPAFKPVFKSLLESAAGIFITIVAFAFILGSWDVNIGTDGNPVTAFIDTLVILFIGWFLYRAVIAYVDHKLEEEGLETSVVDDDAGEMGGAGASRLATLLPLLRNVGVVTIAVLTGMVLMSNAGVDIAPLFAGAGVIGLAVGFGAQTMIRDIFSGGFFLFDDAFRKGEYIEMENIRGTVEKISLRSFQLRHHNGPLHTIPFGEIKQLTNYSRDWVMMKLPLRLTYDTDVERVRKLIKKLGQQLLEHPEVGHLFLQPLKSQGVYKMEDSAMIIRVKFMTKPGDQFVTRKVVYASIRELFEQEGIRFASKEVTVRLAEEPSHPLTDAEKSAVAAAARRIVDDETVQETKPSDDKGL